MLQYIQGFNPNYYSSGSGSGSGSGSWMDYLGPIGDVAGGIYGIINNERNWKHQKEIDAFNKDMAQKNYEMAMAQMNWQQEAQKTAWAREDNAVQRRVADLEAAGMSKWLAAGQAAQSGGVTASNVSSASNLINSGANLKDTNYLKGSMDSFLLGSQRKADISITEAQQELTEANIDNVEQDTINKSAGVNKTLAETEKIYQDLQNSVEELSLMKQEYDQMVEVWKSQKNKNSAEAMQARQQAEYLQIQAQIKMRELNAFDIVLSRENAESDERIKNSKNERGNRTANTTRQFIRDLSNVIRSWVPFFGSDSGSIGFQFFD